LKKRKEYREEKKEEKRKEKTGGICKRNEN